MAINNQPTIKPQTITGIFTRYMAKTIPLAFDESMSYYECLCALLEYINKTVMPDLNNVNEGLGELQQFYLDLQNYVNNYFDNLDVQEEINNKLDDMVESGELQEIISEYLESTAIWAFDTINDMKSSTNLIDGSYAKTLGYYELNDGGSALYKIRNKTNADVDNGGSIIVLNENYVAEMMTFGKVNVLTWGVKKQDATTQTNLNSLLSNYSSGNIKIYFPSGEYYLTETLYLPTRTKIYGDGGSTILSWYGSANTYMLNIKRGNVYCMINDLCLDGKTIAYGIFDCDKTYSGDDGVRSKIYNLILDNMKLGIRMDAMGSEFYNILCNGSRYYDDETSIGFLINGTDNFINNCRIFRFGLGLSISNNNNRLVVVKSCVNGTGARVNNGSCGFYNLDLQENFRDNIVISNTSEANFIMSNQLAGMSTVYVNGNDLQYSLIKIQNCNSISLSGSLGGRTKIGDGSCGNEKYAIYIDDTSTYITGNFSYVYRFHLSTVRLDKPIFHVPDDITNNIVVNNTKIEGTLTFDEADIASVAGTGATQSVSYTDNVITVNFKTSTNLNNRQNVCLFTTTDMDSPQVFLITSPTIFFERFVIQFANYTNNKYMSYESGFTLQHLVTAEGGCLFKVVFDGLSAIISEHQAEIEEYLGGEIEGTRLTLGGYGMQVNDNTITIQTAFYE